MNGMISMPKGRIIKSFYTKRIKKTDYIRCQGVTAEKIEGRTRVAFARCENGKCRRMIAIYKDELKKNALHFSKDVIVYKKCSCGRDYKFILEDWYERIII